MPVYENERGTYIFNSKDLCMIEHMDDVLEAGIDSLKIEGRMKTALYVATVAGSLPLDFSMESQMKPRRFTTTIRTKKAIRILVILKGAERTAVTVSPRGISSCWAKR